jgi:GT2 family glycosyltransferase
VAKSDDPEPAERSAHLGSVSGMTVDGPAQATLVVPGNRWDKLDVAPLGEWHPTLTVSVVVPHYDAAQKLSLTLAALDRQSYPAGLLEVIVVDDGSPVPPDVPAHLGDVPLRLLVQDDHGFRAGTARNLGVSHASGEIVIFLDCDMVPDQRMVEAHARWHHQLGYAVTLGFRTHVSFAGVTSDVVRTALKESGGLGEILATRAQEKPEYIDFHMQRTAELTTDDDDLFRVVASGNLGIRRAFFNEIGKFDESFNQWGGEDTEFGYRAFVGGALLVPDREAHCWHQGIAGYKVEQKQASLREQRATLTQLIAHRGFRSSSPGRSFTIPHVAVRVPVPLDASSNDAIRIVSDVLGSTLHDLAVGVELPDEHADAEVVRRQFAGDCRVRVAPRVNLLAAFPATPVLVELPEGATVRAGCIAEAMQRLESKKLGTLHVTVSGAPEGAALAVFRTRRALARSIRVGADPTTLDAVAGALFPEAWAAGSILGIHDVSGPPPVGAAPTVVPAGPTGSPGDMVAVQQFVARLSADERRRLLALAERALLADRALRTLRTQRDRDAAWSAFMALGRATLPASVVTRLRPPLRRAVYRVRRRRASR